MTRDDVYWARWHELIDKDACEDLQGTEVAEFGSMCRVVAEMDAEEARLGAHSMDRALRGMGGST